jgi:hypothetical protein
MYSTSTATDEASILHYVVAMNSFRNVTVGEFMRLLEADSLFYNVCDTLLERGWVGGGSFAEIVPNRMDTSYVTMYL